MLQEQMCYIYKRINIKFLNKYICSSKCRFLYEDFKYYLNPRCILFDKQLFINSWENSYPIFNRCKECIDESNGKMALKENK